MKKTGQQSSAGPKRSGPWKKGQTGNPRGRPKGVPNKVTQEVREWARAVFNNPKVQTRTMRQAEAGKLAPQIFNELLHYAYGKPKERVEMDLTMLDVGKLTDAQLKERAVALAKALADDEDGGEGGAHG